MIGWTTNAMASEVTLDGATWVALQPPVRPTPAAPGAIWARRDVALVPVEDALAVESVWTVLVPEEGWATASLSTPDLRVRSVTLDGAPSGVAAEADRLVWVGHLSKGVHRLALTGTVPGDPARAPIVLNLAPAGAGTVRFAVEGGDAGIPLGNGLFAGASPAVRVAVHRAAPAASGAVARADVGLGVVVGEGVAAMAARFTWTVEQGVFPRVEFEVPGAGADLQVTGGDVVSWSRAGDRVTAELGHPATGMVRLEARWTAPIAGEAVPIPRVAAIGVRRTRAALQVARDGDLEPVAELSGWTQVASHELPAWAADLAPGSPVGSWTAPANAGGRVALLRFEPTGGPPAIVDVAAWTVATTEEGRMLVSGRLEVRNDRAAWLRVSPPPGAAILSARVDGKTALVAGDRGGWWIPLARSVETVDGLLSFPVEIVLLGATPAWERGENAVVLPTVDAPVAVTRATVHLPPGWESRTQVGEDHVVPEFSEGEGITYGLTSDVDRETADALFQSAVNAWKENDFSAAQVALDDARSLGADNDNMRRLQGNVDLVSGKSDAAKDSVAERRVLEQAKARSFEDANRQEEVLKEARDAEMAGDYDKAEQGYAEAKQIGSQLQRLDTSLVERSGQQAELDAKVDALEKKKAEYKAQNKPEDDEDFRSKVPADRSFGGVVALDGREAEEPPPPMSGAFDLEATGDFWEPEASAAPATPLAGPTPVEPAAMEQGVAKRSALVSVPRFSRRPAPPVEGVLAPPPPPPPILEDVLEPAQHRVVVTSQEIQILGRVSLPDVPLVVAATTTSVVLPTLGQSVRFQQLLLPPGEVPRFQIPARNPRRNQ